MGDRERLWMGFPVGIIVRDAFDHAARGGHFLVVLRQQLFGIDHLSRGFSSDCFQVMPSDLHRDRPSSARLVIRFEKKAGDGFGHLIRIPEMAGMSLPIQPLDPDIRKNLRE